MFAYVRFRMILNGDVDGVSYRTSAFLKQSPLCAFLSTRPPRTYTFPFSRWVMVSRESAVRYTSSSAVDKQGKENGTAQQ